MGLAKREILRRRAVTWVPIKICTSTIATYNVYISMYIYKHTSPCTYTCTLSVACIAVGQVYALAGYCLLIIALSAKGKPTLANFKKTELYHTVCAYMVAVLKS